MNKNLSVQEIVKMSIDDQKKLLSNICSDDVFDVADALGEKEITWTIGDTVECVIEGDDYIYTWIFPEDSDDSIAISFQIACVEKTQHELSSDLDVDLLAVEFETLIDKPFYFTKNGKPKQIHEDYNMTIIEGKITYNDKAVGSLYMYRLFNDECFYEACDDRSGDLAKIAVTICESQDYVSFDFVEIDEPVLILDKLKVDKEYRGKGIGSLIMANLQDMMETQFGINTIFLLAGAYESKKDSKGKRDSSEYRRQSDKLVEFYSRCGFTHIKDRVMYIN